MSEMRNQINTPPLRKASRMEGEAGHIKSSDLLFFAENLVLESNATARVISAAVHLLGQGLSTKVTGEAVCLAQAGNPVWRVSIADETGAALAEITLTLMTDTAKAPVIPIETRRNVDVEDRRTRIAIAARDIFAEKGYAAATMREIASAAGMHVPTMYQYVRAKEDILELVYSWTINQAIDGMKTALSGSGPVDDRMDVIVRRLHEVNSQLRRGTRVMNRETRSLSRNARDQVLGHYAGMIDQIADVIAAGQAEGVFRQMDPQLAAVFVDALADVWVLRPFAVGDTDNETYVTELVAFVRRALTGVAANIPDSPEATKPK